MRLLFLLVLALSSVPAFAQIDAKDVYGPFEHVELRSTARPGSQVLWDFRPLGAQTEFGYREYKDLEGRQVLNFRGQPGKYRAEAIIIFVDFDNKSTDIKRFTKDFVLEGKTPEPPGPGPGPDPGPGPTPDESVPEDKFDNLGRRVDAEADKANLQQDKRFRLSEVFTAVASKLENREYIRVEDASKEIKAAESSLGLDASWDKTRSVIFEDGKTRTPMGMSDAILWYRAVAAGYKGASL